MVKVLEVLLRVISRTPLVKRSTMLKLLLVVVPHVPDCSPFLISSSPVFGAYVLAIYFSYAAISVQIVSMPGLILPHNNTDPTCPLASSPVKVTLELP